MSTVRRHRHGRSHAGGSTGGSSAAVQNEFPVFALTGDVEIVIRAQSGKKEQRYILHRLYLAQCSGFFEAGMSQMWGPGDATTGSADERRHGNDTNGSTKRWRYELDWGGEGEDIPMLVQKPATASIFGGDSAPPPIRPRPPASANGFFKGLQNYSMLNVGNSGQPTERDPSDEIFRTYDNLFRIFYQYPPSLDAVNIANAYVECKSLLQVADMYDALEVVGPRVDHHLLRFQGRLWKQIAKYPPSYLKLGYLARSKVIFAEALIHVVGQWPAAHAQLRGQVPQSVIDLIEDKADELEETKARIEAKLWRLTLTTSRGERVAPQNSWLDWLVISFWRQWFAENTTPLPVGILKDSSSTRNTQSRDGGAGRHSRAPSSSRSASGAPSAANTSSRPSAPQPLMSIGRIYRLINQGGSAYLGHDDMKKLLKSAGSDMYNRDNVKRAERRMEELKNLARDAVQPLMRNFLELDPRDLVSVGYLTCTRVEERDWPWEED